MKNSSIIASFIGMAAYCFSSIALAQTPAPKISPQEGPISKWGPDYQVPGPKEGLVPDKVTAIKIAEVLLFRLYGEDAIVTQRPYQVKQQDDIWWISGTIKEGHLGSVFNIAISKQTAAVLHLEH